MASILIPIVTFILILISLFLILIVLIQRASTNAGLGSSFGGGFTEAAFGGQTGNILTRITIICTIAFFVISFGLYLTHLSLQSDVDRKVEQQLLDITSEPVENAPNVQNDILEKTGSQVNETTPEEISEKIEAPIPSEDTIQKDNISKEGSEPPSA